MPLPAWRRVIAISVLTALILLAAFPPLSNAAGTAESRRQEPGPGMGGAQTAYTVERVTEDWAMWDGEKLPVTVFFPSNAAPGERFPAILVVHGWGMDKTMGEWVGEYYASRGYVALAFTVRGWFGAGGAVGCMDPETEMRDVSHVITLLENDPRFPVLKDEKGPVVGITGSSMGGCFSYLMAPRRDPRPGDPGDPRIRTAVPMHGSFDLLFSLYPNNVVKFLWVSLLLSTAYIGNLSGFMINLVSVIIDDGMDGCQKLQAIMGSVEKLFPLISDVDGRLPHIYEVAMTRRVEEEEEARRFFKLRSARYWCDEEYDGVVEHPFIVPMLILAGWNDDLFYANEGLMAYNSTDAPKKIIITNHGHLGCFPGPYPFEGITGGPESAWVREQVDRWFDRFLKGVQNGVEKEAGVVFYRHTNPQVYGEANAYPLPGTRQWSLYLGGRGSDGEGRLVSRLTGCDSGSELLINIGITGSISIPYIHDAPQLLGGDPLTIPGRIDLFHVPFSEVSYTSTPLPREITIMGPPMFELFYVPSAECTQIIPWLYEVTPEGEEVLVSRGFYEGHNFDDVWMKQNTEKPMEMQAVYHRFRKGSRIRLKLSTADLPTSWPYPGLNIIQLLRGKDSPSRLILPVVPNQRK